MKLRHQKKFVIFLATVLLILSGYCLPLKAQIAESNAPIRNIEINFDPKPVTDNGRQSGKNPGAGTHGGLCQIEKQNLDINPLIALVPKVGKAGDFVYGATTEANPTFFFYIGYSSKTYGEFVLNDENDNEVYRSKLFLLEGTPGLVSFQMPKNEKANLVKGKLYHWYFNIKCDRDSSTDNFVHGWVERLPEVDNQLLVGKQDLELAAIYAKNGLWFNAITQLEQLKNKYPNQEAISQAWLDLLKQGGEPLKDVSQKSVVQRYTPKE